MALQRQRVKSPLTIESIDDRYCLSSRGDVVARVATNRMTLEADVFVLFNCLRRNSDRRICTCLNSWAASAPPLLRVGITATHSAAAAVVCIGLPSFLPSARLRTTIREGLMLRLIGSTFGKCRRDTGKGNHLSPSSR
jgi:hypothetical protein